MSLEAIAAKEEIAKPMRSETRTLEWFLDDPRTRRWIVQCSGCAAYGRKPNTPTTIPKFRFEEMFPVMVLDEERGRCEQCREAEMRSRGSKVGDT